jgi:hypothetical protein
MDNLDIFGLFISGGFVASFILWPEFRFRSGAMSRNEASIITGAGLGIGGGMLTYFGFGHGDMLGSVVVGIVFGALFGWIFYLLRGTGWFRI